MKKFFLNIFELLSSQHKRKGAIIVIYTLFLALFDVASLAAILPVIGLLFKPESIYNLPILPTIYRWTLLPSIESFAVLLLFFLIVFFITKNIFYLILVKIQAQFSYDVATELSGKIYDIYFSRGLGFFNEQNSFLVMRNLTTIPIEFSSNILLQVLNIISESIVLFIIVFGILYINPVVLLIAIISFLPAYVIFYQISKRRMALLLEERSLAYTRVNSYISESIQGFQELKLKNKEFFFKNRYLKDFKTIGKISAKQNLFVNSPIKIMEILAVFSLILLVIYFINSNFSTEKIFVILSVFMAAAYRLIPSSNKIIAGLAAIKSGKYILDVYEEDIKSYSKTSKVKIVEEEIEFKNEINIQDLSFAFDDNPGKLVLKNINLKISKGQTIGLIGKSGSGKTTLINILLGFFKPTSGRITVDNSLLKDENLKSFRKKIGFVRQNTFVLNGSLAENIAFGYDLENISKEKLEKAIYLSGLWDWFEENGKDLNIKLGENGAKISGGQKQRVAIARALFEECEILIFDEATSALDNETEELLNESIKLLKGAGVTMLIIAHKHLSLKFCDYVIKIENGKLNYSK